MHCSANRSPFSHDPATLLDGSAEFFLETNAFFCIDDSIVIFEPSSIVFWDVLGCGGGNSIL
jgi:hypothetical protein